MQRRQDLILSQCPFSPCRSDGPCTRWRRRRRRWCYDHDEGQRQHSQEQAAVHAVHAIFASAAESCCRLVWRGAALNCRVALNSQLYAAAKKKALACSKIYRKVIELSKFVSFFKKKYQNGVGGWKWVKCRLEKKRQKCSKMHSRQIGMMHFTLPLQNT